ncbi:copper amine oxidase N-terminal domain-containing protein [Salsuginibacillus kocurii]|uniref:copper amine oxidase N-terminal domain-containing protein n=1 Tax=Salsuginibacillus kocurii TaxID=427078 RepID=UPI000366BBA2|nr:copper amine oxidase N-terminal domain-containing protein [Salsuginibacillus kocurii]
MNKKWISSLVLGVIGFGILSLSSHAESGEMVLNFDEGTYLYNEETIRLEVPPMLEEGVTYVPMRSFAELLGFDVSFNSSKNEYVMAHSEWGEEITLGNEESALQHTNGDITYANGKNQIVDNRMMIPLRPLTEALGFQIRPRMDERQVDVSWRDKGAEDEGAEIPERGEELDEETWDLHFSEPGTITQVDSQAVLNVDILDYERVEGETPLIRSNSPEHIRGEGYYYRDTMAGDFRFHFHKQNVRDADVNLYLLATNVSDETAEVSLKHLGTHGPSPFVGDSGRGAVMNYLEGPEDSTADQLELAPGERGLIGSEELSDISLPTSYTLTAYADLHASTDVQFEVLALDEQNDVWSTLPYLYEVDQARGDHHTRGTFDSGDRTLYIDERIGLDRSRLIIGGESDSYVTGYDMMTGEPETNTGNRGVVYSVEIDEVEPYTAITLNPRGGPYVGAFRVNGEVVGAPASGQLSNSSEAAMLYRTGANEESVTIDFIPASGSNLPLNILFEPLEEEYMNLLEE